MSSSEEESDEGSDVENTSSDDNSSDGESGEEDSSGSDDDTESDDNAPPPPSRKRKVVAAPAAISRKRKMTGKGSKDPNAPRKPMSSYILYSNSRRASVREDNPGMKFGQITQTIAKQFRELQEKEKRPWEKKAAKDRVRYQQEMANYSAPVDSSDDDNGGTKKKKKKKDPNAPKKALTSYMYFMNRNRASIKEKNPDATFGELARLVASSFRALTPEQKQKYIDLSTIDKERYKKQMEHYVPPKGSGVAKKYKDPNKPKRAMTSFMCFANATRPQVKIDQPNLSFGDVGKTLGKMFRELTPEEKDKFIKIANKDKVRYAKAMEEYNRKEEEKLKQQQQQSNDESASGSEEGSNDGNSSGESKGGNDEESGSSGSEDGSDSDSDDSD